MSNPAFPERDGTKTYVRVEDADGHLKRLLTLPANTPNAHHDHEWEVPLFNPYTGKVSDMGMYNGEVWLGTAASKKGKIVFTGVPNVLETADDARRLAVALLAAADAKDELDNPRKVDTNVQY